MKQLLTLTILAGSLLLTGCVLPPHGHHHGHGAHQAHKKGPAGKGHAHKAPPQRGHGHRR